MSKALRKELKKGQWTAIPLPSSEYRLLTLIFERDGARGSSNDFERLAPGVAQRVMPPEKVGQLPDLSGTAARSRTFDFGLSILSGLIGALGGGTLGLKAAFNSDSNLAFTYSDLSGETVSPVALQRHMNGVLAPSGGLLHSWINDHLYVTTGVLRARKIKLEVTDKNGGELAVDVPVIKDAVGGNVKVGTKNSANSVLEFESDTPAPIGVRLYQVTRTRRGEARFLDLKTVRQGMRIAGLSDGDEAKPEGVEYLPDPMGGGEDAPAPVWLDWDPE